MKIVEDLYYSKEHEWIKVDGNNVYIGISDFAQKSLGDIVFVELPETGNKVNKDDSISVVESVKAASDIYAPVSGKVLKVNGVLDDEPELLNEDPYENWMILIELSNREELKELMNYKEYSDFCDEE
ncbi:MAG: glycine cleavage system protein GcvH [Clostridiales bacterium]